MNIGKLTIDPPVLLAPMAGITDSPFRRVARELGCPAVVTEMVSAEGLIRGGRGSLELLDHRPGERPIVAQIFGSRPESMAQAARLCQTLDFDAIDINMGCPVRKVVSSGAGAALMRDPLLAARVAAAVRQATHLPLSVKLRAGWSLSEINVVEVARRLAGEGVNALVIHPRARDRFFLGRADWRLIGEVVAAVELPVIGNGDLCRPGDGKRMMEQTGCAGVMVGRAARGNPWLPARMAGRGGNYPPSPEEIYRVFCIHLEKMIDWVGSPGSAVRRMRKHAIWYTRGLAGAAEMRRWLGQIDAAAELRRAVAAVLLDGGSGPQ